MGGSRTYLIRAVAVVVIVGAFVYQAKSLRSIKNEIAALSQQVAAAQGEAPSAPSTPREWPHLRQTDYSGRIEQLETAIAQLSRATDYLMERGQLPMATNKLEDLQRRLADASLPERDRLQALRLLRRNQGLNDEGIRHALDLVNASTNSNIRREVLQSLDGITNTAARSAMLALATGDADSNVREEAIENLRHFVLDSNVESKLWELMKSDPDPEIREQAEDALREGPMSPDRIARLQQWAADPQASLEDKLLALRALRRAGADTSQTTAEIVQMVQATTDSTMRARVFDSWDGSRDPAVKLPLVNGLQDPNPIVRQRAADALSGFITDPAVQQWLNYITQTDPDPLVRREAFQALNEAQRR